MLNEERTICIEQEDFPRERAHERLFYPCPDPADYDAKGVAPRFDRAVAAGGLRIFRSDDLQLEIAISMLIYCPPLAAPLFYSDSMFGKKFRKLWRS